MPVDAITVRKLSGLGLTADQLASVVEIMEEVATEAQNHLAARRGADAERQRRSRDKRLQGNVTPDPVTLRSRDVTVTPPPPDGPLPLEEDQTPSPLSPPTPEESALKGLSAKIADPIDDALHAYNLAAGKAGWPKTVPFARMSPSRRQKLAKALKSVGSEGWAKLMEVAGRSAFLSGAGPRARGHEGWRPDLDFFLRPQVLQRLQEGFYGGDGSGGRTQRKTFADIFHENAEPSDEPEQPPDHDGPTIDLSAARDPRA